MGEFEDTVARTVIAAFSALPAKSKPKLRPDATEWVPLAGITLETTGGEVVCVALATGMKCLPHAKIPLAAGMVLHDCHAEVLTIRAFNCFLAEECRKLASDTSYTSEYLYRRPPPALTAASPQPFAIHADVRIHFYSSEAPCGDASMELTISSQTDATPWTNSSSSSSSPSSTPAALLRGRGYFASLGAVRTKPGRADSPPTLSKSCSDKLALRQSVSTLLSPLSLLVAPENAYLASLVLHKRVYSSVACNRAFGETGRMGVLQGRGWGGGYMFRPFKVRTTDVEFEFVKTGVKAVGSNVSAVWVRGRGAETLIGGVLQGRKQFSGVRGASMLCKARMWKAVSGVVAVAVVGVRAAQIIVDVAVYGDLKEGVGMVSRNRAKVETRAALGGWARNGGDDFGMVE